MAPLRVIRPRMLVLFAFESLLILSVVYGLAALTLVVSPDLPEPHVDSSIWWFTGLFSILLWVTQSATVDDQSGLLREMVLFSLISVVTGLAIFVVLWIVFLDLLRLPTLLAIEAAIAVPIAVGLWRWFSVRFSVLNATRENVLIVGTGESARQVCRWIVTNLSGEYAVMGFADENRARLGTLLAMGARVQMDYQSLPTSAPGRVDRVIVAIDEKRGKLPVRQLMELRLLGIEIEEATTFIERVSGRIWVETMLPSWLIFSEGFKTSELRSFLKRAADILHAGVLLMLASPLMILTAVAIKFDSRGPVLYRQARLGAQRREFEVLKFRSMRQDAEKDTGPTWASESDPRVTRIGRIIRKLRIDELPQLFNVLRGDMSFVGPRPERAHFVRQLEQRIPYYGLRMLMRPGLTGWAQVEYGYGASEDDALEKLKYDLYYIKNNNLLLDLWIVLKTIRVVLRGSGAR